MVIISSVDKNSPAEKAGIKKGEKIIAIDSHPVNDVLDYRFFITESKIEITIENNSGEKRNVSVKKPRYDDIGLNFDTYLMDKKKSCRNKCIFCFIDQNPCGMRETVYFKDDDTRLSFLMGNYVTLTNTSDEELQRIIKMRLSPVNISVHTTNPELRKKMLGNRFAGKILEQLKTLYDGKIQMNIQIVLVNGINDGKELEKTLDDLEKFFPYVQSVAVVPCGVTAHRTGLFPITPFDKSSAEKTLFIINEYSEKFLKKHGSRIVFAADEFYLAAKKEFPSEEEYEGYMQLDNGVGLIKNTETEISEELENIVKFDELSEYSARKVHITLATGVAASDLMKRLCTKIMEKMPNIKFDVVTVHNKFFGETVTVAGLLTGSDYLRELKGVKSEYVMIPAVSLRSERDLFLDDMSVTELEKKLGVPVYPTENGVALFDTLKMIVNKR